MGYKNAYTEFAKTIGEQTNKNGKRYLKQKYKKNIKETIAELEKKMSEFWGENQKYNLSINEEIKFYFKEPVEIRNFERTIPHIKEQTPEISRNLNNLIEHLNTRKKISEQIKHARHHLRIGVSKNARLSHKLITTRMILKNEEKNNFHEERYKIIYNKTNNKEIKKYCKENILKYKFSRTENGLETKNKEEKEQKYLEEVVRYQLEINSLIELELRFLMQRMDKILIKAENELKRKIIQWESEERLNNKSAFKTG